MLRNILYSLGLLLLLLSGCKQVSNASLLDEISGVWKMEGENSLVTLNHAGGTVQLVMDDRLLPVSLGTVDKEQETINLKGFDANGKPLLWTIRRVWDKEHKTFNLLMTLHNGVQADLSFVRKISKEDTAVIASLQAASVATTQPAAPVPATPATSSIPVAGQSQANTQAKPDDASFSTKAGIATFVTEDSVYGKLVLNDKVLLEDVMGVTMQARYLLGEQEVAVLEVVNGGNGACPIDYYFLSTKRDGQAALSSSISCHHEAELKTKVVGTRIHATISASESDGNDEYEFDAEQHVLLKNGKVVSD